MTVAGRKGLARLPIILLILLLCAGLAVHLALSRVLTRLVNESLPEITGTDAGAGRIRVGLLRGSIVVTEARVANPDGFGGGEALVIPEMRARLDLLSLRRPVKIVREISIRQARIRIVRNAAGKVNLEALLERAATGADQGNGPGRQEPPAGGPGRAASGSPGARPSRQARPGAVPGPVAAESAGLQLEVKRLSIEELTLSYVDPVLKLEKVLKDVDVLATGLSYAPGRAKEASLPAKATLTARMGQEPWQDALVGLYVRMGVIGNEVPALNGSLQLAGLELGALGPAVPRGAPQLLGGNALDLSAEGSVAPDRLRLLVRVQTNGGTSFALPVGGTPSSPVVDSSNVVAKLLQNGLASVAGRVSDPNVLAGTAVKTGRTLGQGLAGMLGTAASGLLKTTQGIATADLGAAASGLGETAAGTLREGAATATGAAAGIASGIGPEGGPSAGRAQAWREATPKRWEAACEKARQRVDPMPYPGR
ncbi:MAG: hypothetical protein AB1640_20165 [bacterium]